MNLTQGVADGDARAELLKLAVRKIVEEALEAEVAEAVGRAYYENGATPGRRDVRPRVEYAGHRGSGLRCRRAARAERYRGQPDHRAPVAGVRGVRRP